jgi:hypothetical protein
VPVGSEYEAAMGFRVYGLVTEAIIFAKQKNEWNLNITQNTDGGWRADRRHHLTIVVLYGQVKTQ